MTFALQLFDQADSASCASPEQAPKPPIASPRPQRCPRLIELTSPSLLLLSLNPTLSPDQLISVPLGAPALNSFDRATSPVPLDRRDPLFQGPPLDLALQLLDQADSASCAAPEQFP